MVNKVVVGMLVVLLLLTSAIGVYLYHLTTEINALSERLITSHKEEAARVDMVGSMLAAYTQETNDRLDIIGRKVEDNRYSILATEEAVQRESGRFSTLEGEVDDITGKVDGITDELSEDKPRLQAHRVYEEVNQSVVEVSDGRNTIGSGFIYDDRGHVVTAHHVIEQLDSIYVVFPDGSVSRARVVGSSDISDVAVLLLERQFDVTPLVMADSENIMIGEVVVAIGSPFDLGGTVTAGIVSQLNRFEDIGGNQGSRWIANLIQFDAPANFGNSGGPLINVDGDVIGLIIARVGPATGEGISYAVSSNKVKRVADTILEEGVYDYPWLGIEAGDITPELAEELNRETVHGVLVGSVMPNSPAWKGGVKEGDIITSISGTTVHEMADLTSYLGEHTGPGGFIVIMVVRGGLSLELTVVLDTR